MITSMLVSIVGTEDLPVWMVYNKPSVGPVPVLVGWFNALDFDYTRFLSLRTFGTEEEAQVWISEFWQAYWALAK
jgi:hypothetical protein